MQLCRVFCNFAAMKYWTIFSIIALTTLCGCTLSDDKKAEEMLSQIKSYYEQGQYDTALDSIESLRTRYPKAINARKEALILWQNASLKLAQHDIASTDSALQVAIQDFTLAQAACEKAPTHDNLLRRNMSGVKRDSLQARYDAMCALVRVIHKRQAEQ